MADVPMIPTNICGRWTLLLPQHRAERAQWPWWEKPRMESMWHNLRHGDVIVDVGTEEGDQSALFAQWVKGGGPCGECQERGLPASAHCDWHNASRSNIGGVILVEPNPRVWPNVKAIWEANDIPPPIASFVGFLGPDIRGTTDDSLDWEQSAHPREPEQWPGCAYGPVIGDHGFLNIYERPEVPVITMDRLLESLDRKADAITMDVEGAEWEVLKGATFTLRHDRPLIWVSIHPEFIADVYGQSRQELLDWMAGYGYEHYHLAAEHEHHVLFWHPEGRKPILPYGRP